MKFWVYDPWEKLLLTTRVQRCYLRLELSYHIKLTLTFTFTTTPKHSGSSTETCLFTTLWNDKAALWHRVVFKVSTEPELLSRHTCWAEGLQRHTFSAASHQNSALVAKSMCNHANFTSFTATNTNTSRTQKTHNLIYWSRKPSQYLWCWLGCHCVTMPSGLLINVVCNVIYLYGIIW